jgi:putative flippase GtrA
LIVGGTVFVFNTLLLWLFKRKLYFRDSVAISLAYAMSAVLHFTLNNFFTFSGSDARYGRRLAGYLFVLACNYFISLIIGNIVFKYIIDNVAVVSIFCTACTTVLSYLILYKLVFFHRMKEKKE